MKVLCAVMCAILLAGVHGTTVVNRDPGDFYAFTIIAIGHEIARCDLKTAAGSTLQFTPGTVSQHGDRYELQPISSLPACTIRVNDLTQSDSGFWEIAFVNSAGAGSSQSFQLIVGDVDGETTNVPEDESGHSSENNEDEKDKIEWLHHIEFPTRIGQIIDISLPRIDREEECYIRLPKGEIITAANVNIEGVNYHNSSYFVSCRITIGPMVKELLGNWALCGKYTENYNEHERCINGHIFWNTENNPGTEWHIDNRPMFDHPVYYDSTLNPVVLGNGDVVACHIITTEGENLVIDHDSSYPSIKVAITHSTCSFSIGPIHTELLGNWTIYGLFRNSIEGLHEVRFPFNMHIYDPEDPYNKAYNVTVRDPVKRVVNFETMLYVEVGVDTGVVDNCYFETPAGDVYTLSNDYTFYGASFVEENDGTIACRVAIGPITESLLGDWKIIGKFSNNLIFTEIRQTFHVIKEDPENPIQEDRTISYLTEKIVETEIGAKHKFVIPSHEFIYGESCHIRSPEGLQYQITNGFSIIAGIEFTEEDGVECGVFVTVASESIVGNWTLIARAKHHSEPIERRLPFTIYVEESVEALKDTITLDEGSDLRLSLRYPTEHFESCRLIGPYGFECQVAVRDPEQMETCTFIRRDAQTFNTGTWTITYGDRIVYKARISVTVNAGDSESNIPEPEVSSSTLNLARDSFVSQYVGPENAVYCRVEDPQGLTTFDHFGRCYLTIDKVEPEHQGTWKLHVALPNRVLTDEYHLFVRVVESEGKSVVTTRVAQNKPIVDISCYVQPSSDVRLCKFRNPQGKILIAASGVSEDRYSFFGTGASYESGVLTHECGIRITDPVTSDLGLWRCALETSTDTYYGHLPVLCPWALSNPTIAATVQQEPVLKTSRSLVSVVEEEPAVMSCSVESAIRYCYFRSSNGTTFTVSPASTHQNGSSSSSMEYVGAGFDAGECGIRFQGLHARDSGRWSCHVGLVGDHDEQRDQFQLTVHERMVVDHFTSHNIMTVQGIVYEGRALEYCRFVRIDGFGFTSDHVPAQYTMTGILANGECRFTARDPTILDIHPWTIAAKIRGQDAEISKDTMESVIIGEEEAEEENPGQIVIVYRTNGLTIFMYVFLSLLLVSILIGGLLGPKKNRQWTAQRATAIRNSFSRKPQQVDQLPPNYSP